MRAHTGEVGVGRATISRIAADSRAFTEGLPTRVGGLLGASFVDTRVEERVGLERRKKLEGTERISLLHAPLYCGRTHAELDQVLVDLGVGLVSVVVLRENRVSVQLATGLKNGCSAAIAQ